MPRRHTRALLYFLAARPEPIPRARIAFLFWPDEADAVARRQLTRLLSSLRAAPQQPDLLRVDEENVAVTLDQGGVVQLPLHLSGLVSGVVYGDMKILRFGA